MLSNTLRFSVVSGLALGLAGAAGACSATGNTSQFTGTHGTGAGNPSGTGGASASSSGISLGGSVSTGSGTSSGVGGSCAAKPYVAQQLPLDMYIMQDQSGSMSDMVAGGQTKWQAVTGALGSFVNQPGLTDIAVGIQYFAQGGSEACTCATSADCKLAGDTCLAGLCFSCVFSAAPDSCTASDYEKPEVEIAALPGVAGAIVSSLGKHKPATGTPTGPALQGALDHAKAWAGTHPGHVVVAVVATDGEPQECSPTDQASIAAIAAAALAGTPSVKTFAIGVFAAADMPSGPDLLNAVAAAGGTGQAFNINTSQNVNAQFLAALNAIRGTALGCQYSIPTPTSGTPDYNAVNVQYTPGGGGAPVDFLQYTDKAHCPASGDGWYYDDNQNPTQIELCPTSCSTVGADSKGKIDILLGCQTKKAT